MLIAKVAVTTNVLPVAELWGWSVLTPAFGPWHVRFRAGGVVGGPIIGQSNGGLATTNSSDTQMFKQGIATGGSIYVETVSGTAPEIIIYCK